MRRVVPWYVLTALAMLVVPASAETSFSVGINIGNAPPPPVMVWHHEPRMVPIQTVGIWYYDGPGDYDYFRYGHYYYAYSDGFWYRSPYYRGPFVAIREDYVPRAFYGLDERGYHWRHPWRYGPPGQVRKMERQERAEYHEHGHGHGHGHGHDEN